MRNKKKLYFDYIVQCMYNECVQCFHEYKFFFFGLKLFYICNKKKIVNSKRIDKIDYQLIQVKVSKKYENFNEMHAFKSL